MFFELTFVRLSRPLQPRITWQKATARCHRLLVVGDVFGQPCLDSAFQQPMILAASSTLSWLFRP